MGSTSPPITAPALHSGVTIMGPDPWPIHAWATSPSRSREPLEREQGWETREYVPVAAEEAVTAQRCSPDQEPVHLLVQLLLPSATTPHLTLGLA